jgi:hypothetical protein
MLNLLWLRGKIPKIPFFRLFFTCRKASLSGVRYLVENKTLKMAVIIRTKVKI